ncbi:hypothetical protein NSQ62_03670 [Solibacillus sp. FSL H8-0523]|uniref:hypothetical protein n=1 Tax=unclassified Solibacillus TaxID=2637870 RepID=UPI00310106C1
MLFPEVTHAGADLGYTLFMEALFPYLLPYLILTSWLIRISATSSTVSYFTFLQTYFISAIGGFPTGAATIVQLTKQQAITKHQAAYLLGICHSPSPLFLFGFVGQDLLQSTTFSWYYLLLIHSFSLCLLTIVYPVIRSDSSQLIPLKKEATPFTNSIRDSAPTILTVAITLIFFTTIYHVVIYSLEQFTNVPLAFKLFTASLLEMTNGLATVQQHLSGDLLLFCCVVLLTTQGLSIHLQVIVIARTAGLSIRPYIALRALYSLCIPLLYLLFFM